jgi:hypothetical protein
MRPFCKWSTTRNITLERIKETLQGQDSGRIPIMDFALVVEESSFKATNWLSAFFTLAILCDLAIPVVAKKHLTKLRHGI